MDASVPRGTIETLHFVLGDSAGGSAHEGLDLTRDGLVCDDDPLYCGPLPPMNGFSRWRAGRARWWRELDPRGYARYRPPNVRRLRQALKRSRTVHLWSAIGLSEQLFLAHWATALRGPLAFRGPVRVTVFERVEWENGESFPAATSGWIAADRFRHPPPPRDLAGSLAADLAGLWEAATAPTPTPLLAYIAEPPGDSWPRRAVRSLLNRYPDARTGLTRWDAALLAGVAEHAPSAIKPVADTLFEADEEEKIGDGWLWFCLRRMADRSRPNPLLEIKFTGGREMRHAAVALSDAGRTVLAGEANAVALRGIDRWAGGVHLDSAAGRVWYRDGMTVLADGAAVPSRDRQGVGRSRDSERPAP